MRTLKSWLRTSARKYSSSAMNLAIVAGFVGLTLLPPKTEPMGDMQSFVEDQTALFDQFTDEEMNVLAQAIMKASKGVKKLSVERDIRSISDGDYGQLPRAWKAEAERLVTKGTCNRFDEIIRSEVGNDAVEFLITKARLIIESSCIVTASGTKDDRGLSQVRQIACKDVGIFGNLFDIRTNIRCGVRYFQKLCTTYGYCLLSTQVVAYNRGPEGAKLVVDAQAEMYARKYGFVLALLRQKA